MVLRAGLIGLGMMGRNHARVMSSTDQGTLVGIADPIGDPAGNIDHSLLVESVPELIEIGIVCFKIPDLNTIRRVPSSIKFVVEFCNPSSVI